MEFTKSETDLRPCISATHGFDPMKVQFSIYMKVLGYGYTFAPSWLSFKLFRGSTKNWLGPSCREAMANQRSFDLEMESNVCTHWWNK
jgi:hypothetical protein